MLVTFNPFPFYDTHSCKFLQFCRASSFRSVSLWLLLQAGRLEVGSGPRPDSGPGQPGGTGGPGREEDDVTNDDVTRHASKIEDDTDDAKLRHAISWNNGHFVDSIFPCCSMTLC